MTTNTKKPEVENKSMKTNKTNKNPIDCSIKQTLRLKWSLWYLESNVNRSWEDNLYEITSFDTLKDFWRMYKLIRLPSEIKINSDYFLFKYGIPPILQHEANKLGGRWVITLSKQQRNSDLDKLWLNVMLSLIGEVFENSDQICGAGVSVGKRKNIIAIWTADGSNKTAIYEIGLKLRETLRLSSTEPIHYKIHSDVMNRKSLVEPNYIL